MSQPLITALYTADPSAHSFPSHIPSEAKAGKNRLYIYPSHDRETDIPFNDRGDQYDMADYHVFSVDPESWEPAPEDAEGGEGVLGKVVGEGPGGRVRDHGVVLRQEDVPWVQKQVWAPDCARSPSTGLYHLFFPARNKSGIFQIGVATSKSPVGPFTPEQEAIKGSYSIDPAVFVDEPSSSSSPSTDSAGQAGGASAAEGEGEAYLLFGGIWGGQLQCYPSASSSIADFNSALDGPHEPSGASVPALCPRIARLTPDFLSLAEPVRDLIILDPVTRKPLEADDHERRFFEAAWMHKKDGKYYFSYSTGDTHFICYASSESVYGPFTYEGRVLEPVKGWTTHHSIVQHESDWWLFYHDCSLSNGVDHLRSVKRHKLQFGSEGKIRTIKPYA